MLDYTSGSKSWRLVGSLPFPLYATRATNVAGIVYLAGGYDGETHYSHQCRRHYPADAMIKPMIALTGASYTASVFSWDGVAEVWSESGKLSHARGYHAVTEVPLADLCSRKDM